MLRIHDVLVYIRILIWIRGSMPLTNGSGFGSGSSFFRHQPSRCQQKTNFFKKDFLLIYFLKVHLHYFLRYKVKKKSNISRNQGFSYYFCLVIEGSGSGGDRRTRIGIHISDFGSGSRRPKNIRILRIRIRIRIRNTGLLIAALPNSIHCCRPRGGLQQGREEAGWQGGREERQAESARQVSRGYQEHHVILQEEINPALVAPDPTFYRSHS